MTNQNAISPKKSPNRCATGRDGPQYALCARPEPLLHHCSIPATGDRWPLRSIDQEFDGRDEILGRRWLSQVRRAATGSIDVQMPAVDHEGNAALR